MSEEQGEKESKGSDKSSEEKEDETREEDKEGGEKAETSAAKEREEDAVEASVGFPEEESSFFMDDEKRSTAVFLQVDTTKELKEGELSEGEEADMTPGFDYQWEIECEREPGDKKGEDGKKAKEDKKEKDKVTKETEKIVAEAVAMLDLTPSEEELARNLQIQIASEIDILSDEEDEEKLSEYRARREGYTDEYKKLLSEKYVLNKQNVMLQKRINDFCKKRKMEIYFQEIQTPDPELEKKYFKQLRVYEDFRKQHEKTKSSISKELKALSDETNNMEDLLRNQLNSMIERERTIGTSIVAKGGKQISDKFLERLLQKQKQKVLDIGAVRHKYIKLRDRVAEKELALEKTESIISGVHLMDYEQLRMENQSYGDKVEERDEELARLRNKATSVIQILAHVREKISSTSRNIDDVFECLDYSEIEVNNAREYLGSLKKQREELREEAATIKQESGLLMLPTLLRDFERSIEEQKEMEEELRNIKEMYNCRNRRLTTIRKTIVMARRHRSTLANEHRRSFEEYTDLLEQKTRTLPERPRQQRMLHRPFAKKDVSSEKQAIIPGRPSFFPDIRKSM